MSLCEPAPLAKRGKTRAKKRGKKKPAHEVLGGGRKKLCGEPSQNHGKRKGTVARLHVWMRGGEGNREGGGDKAALRVIRPREEPKFSSFTGSSDEEDYDDGERGGGTMSVHEQLWRER